MSVRVTWDPGGSKFVRGFAATAWGQAVFQGGEYVMILVEIPWAGPIKGHGLDLDREKIRTGLLSIPRRKASQHKRTTTITARSVEGPELEEQRVAARGELCSILPFSLLPPSKTCIQIILVASRHFYCCICTSVFGSD